MYYKTLQKFVNNKKTCVNFNTKRGRYYKTRRLLQNAAKHMYLSEANTFETYQNLEIIRNESNLAITTNILH